MEFTFIIHSGENEIFDKDAFKDTVGKKINKTNFGEATVVDVVVINEGTSALLTLNTIEEKTLTRKYICINCQTQTSDVWRKCCPTHTTEQGLDATCDKCYTMLHPKKGS